MCALKHSRILKQVQRKRRFSSACSGKLLSCLPKSLNQGCHRMSLKAQIIYCMSYFSCLLPLIMEVGGLLQDLFPLQECRFPLNHDYGRKGTQIAFTPHSVTVTTGVTIWMITFLVGNPIRNVYFPLANKSNFRRKRFVQRWSR